MFGQSESKWKWASSVINIWNIELHSDWPHLGSNPSRKTRQWQASEGHVKYYGLYPKGNGKHSKVLNRAWDDMCILESTLASWTQQDPLGGRCSYPGKRWWNCRLGWNTRMKSLEGRIHRTWWQCQRWREKLKKRWYQVSDLHHLVEGRSSSFGDRGIWLEACWIWDTCGRSKWGHPLGRWSHIWDEQSPTWGYLAVISLQKPWE